MYTTQEYQEQLNLLLAAEFSPKQAGAIMQHVEQQQAKSIGELATKRQLADVELALRGDMEKMEASLRAEIANVRTELKHEISDVRTELKHEISDVRKDLSHRMTIGFIILFFMSMIGPNLPSIVSFIANWFK